MAIFSRKQKSGGTAKASKKETAVSRVRVSTVRGGGDATVLKSPRVTEKVTMLAEQNVYTFNVAESATKQSIANAITAVYNVVPVKVRIVSIPRKSVFVRGKRGFRAGGKKAYIYLAKGDKISIS